MTKGPAGRIREALLYRQHRRQGSAGAWERRRGVAPLAWTCGSAGNTWKRVARRGIWGWSGLSTHRAGWARRPQPFDPALVHFCIFSPVGSAPGVPEAGRSLGWPGCCPLPSGHLSGARSHGARHDPYASSLQRATRGYSGSAPGWNGHRDQRGRPGGGHAPVRV